MIAYLRLRCANGWRLSGRRKNENGVSLSHDPFRRRSTPERKALGSAGAHSRCFRGVDRDISRSSAIAINKHNGSWRRSSSGIGARIRSTGGSTFALTR